MIAACMDHQTTPEMNITGDGKEGICTYGLRQALGEGKNPTYRELLHAMREYSDPDNYMVQMSTNFELDMEHAFAI